MKNFITCEEARKMLLNGNWVLAENGREIMVIKTFSELQRLEQLKENEIIQLKLFVEITEIPIEAMQVSYEEAMELLGAYELVYYINENGEEDEINSLTELERVYRGLSVRFQNPVLYWYVE
ncbi:MAG: hypothetical protein ACLTEH_03980 [Clostridia bacterium]